ncbi:MAG: hypothetical protein KF861_12190 [Planctomycetaceae bacterium]|nr:hypothetical protein [Planctomycetaceae bacterium]
MSEPETELITSHGNRLDSCTNIIRAANERYAGEFVEWVTAVGTELRVAQELLAVNGSHASEFGRWVQTEFGWTARHARHLIAATEIMSILGTTVPRTNLPSNEYQCRELLKLPDADRQSVWQDVCDKVEQNRQAIENAKADGREPPAPLTVTAKLIRETAEPYLPADDVAPSYDDEIDEDATALFDAVKDALRDAESAVNMLKQQKCGKFIRKGLFAECFKKLVSELDRALPVHVCRECGGAGCIFCGFVRKVPRYVIEGQNEG